jgi:hypothetical protein
VETGNNSHRYNQSTLAAKSRIKEREQSRKKSKAAPLVSTVSQRDGTLGLFDQDTRWTDGLLHQAT